MKLVTLQRLADDKICLRVSMGGNNVQGYYCAFRGDQSEVIEMIETVLTVLRNAPALEVEPEKDLRYLF